jgi:hypothetical protein
VVIVSGFFTAGQGGERAGGDGRVYPGDARTNKRSHGIKLQKSAIISTVSGLELGELKLTRNFRECLRAGARARGKFCGGSCGGCGVGCGDWRGGAELIESRGWGGPGFAGLAGCVCCGRGGCGRHGGVAAGAVARDA